MFWKLESDHGGIERKCSSTFNRDFRRMLESDHGGIERWVVQELKGAKVTMLESDHGGIESGVDSDWHIHEFTVVRIGPWWD